MVGGWSGDVCYVEVFYGAFAVFDVCMQVLVEDEVQDSN